MTSIVPTHPTLAARSLSRLVLAVLVALLLTTSAADAALTTNACLVSTSVSASTVSPVSEAVRPAVGGIYALSPNSLATVAIGRNNRRG